MTRIRVVVTAEDIAGPGSGSCPIERALRRSGYREAIVGRTAWLPNVRVSTDNQSRALPAAARAFIERFDAEKPVKPATFYLEGPSR